MNSFTELATWQAARELRNSISKLAKTFPDKEIRFCRLSRGSLYETLDHLICAFDENYTTESVFNAHKEMFDTCLKILNGYIAYLKKAKTEKETILAS